MMSVDFTSRPLMPMASALTSSAFAIMSAMRHLDAEVVDLVAVVREDDVDEVLADVVDVALHRGEHDAALAVSPSACSMCGSRCATDVLHRLGRLQHERQLHLARAEELADDLHPAQQHVVDDVERRRAGRERLVEVVGRGRRDRRR